MARPLAFASLLFLAGCAGGKPWPHSKAGDPAHPAAALEVQGSTAPMRLAVGGESRQVELQGNDSLVLTGTAEDKGGVKDMILQGNALVTCSDTASGASFTKTTGFLRRHMPGSPLRGRAPSRRDSRFVLRTADIARVCPGGRLDSAVGLARLQVSNYRGGSAATPHLEFRIAAGEAAAKAIPMPGPRQSRAGSLTGFAPQSGVGGTGAAPESGARAPATAPRMCPRSAAPGRAAETRASGDECLDAPVAPMSPPTGSAPAASAAPTSRVASPRNAQRSQIHRI